MTSAFATAAPNGKRIAAWSGYLTALSALADEIEFGGCPRALSRWASAVALGGRAAENDEQDADMLSVRKPPPLLTARDSCDSDDSADHVQIRTRITGLEVSIQTLGESPAIWLVAVGRFLYVCCGGHRVRAGSSRLAGA